MKKRWLWWIILSVVLLHVGAFMFIANMKPLPKKKFIAPPTFIARQKDFVDAETGGKITVREYTVSTKLDKIPPLEQ